MRYCLSSRAGFLIPPSPSPSTFTTAGDAPLVDSDAAVEAAAVGLLLRTEASTRPCCRWVRRAGHEEEAEEEEKKAPADTCRRVLPPSLLYTDWRMALNGTNAARPPFFGPPAAADVASTTPRGAMWTRRPSRTMVIGHSRDNSGCCGGCC